MPLAVCSGIRIPGKKVCVLGLGVSGFASARFLAAQGYQVSVSESSDSKTACQAAGRLRGEGIVVEVGGHTPALLEACDWVVTSPGILPSSPVLSDLKQRTIPVFSEIEVASWYCPSQDIIAVTGTCGKTTVVTLIADLLRKSGQRVACCGNIGDPWIGSLEQIEPGDCVVLELSSFQLQYCRDFHASTAVLLNISPNHLDWHRDMQDYANAKTRIFNHQTESDVALYRQEDRDRFFAEFSLKARQVVLEKEAGRNPNLDVLREIARLRHLDEGLADEVFESFKGIEHRMELFQHEEGIRYINDSKSTTPAALAWALDRLPEGKVVLLAGGHPKSVDFSDLKARMDRKVRVAVLLGEARELLESQWQGACDIRMAGNFEDAVRKACEEARDGDTVILSPACASFDMFRNYIERGKVFKELVRSAVAERLSRQRGTQNPEILRKD